MTYTNEKGGYLMENITIFTKNQFFYIESTHFTFENLRIDNGKETQPFEKEQPNLWKIAALTVAHLLTPHTESRVFIYHGEKEELSTDFFDIQMATNLVLEVEEQPIYLYFSLDNKLRLMWHQIPTARASHLSSCGEWLSQETPQLKITIESKNIPINQVTLILKERQTKESLSISLPISDCIKTRPNTFLNTCFFTFDETLFTESLFSNLDTDSYQFMILDYFIMINSDIFPLTKYQFRLRARKQQPVEGHVSYQQEKTMFLRFYGTSYENLSSRVTMLPYETGAIYLQLAKNPSPLECSEKPIILIFEYPHKAQENGFAFFKYLMKHQTVFDTYYVIEKDSPDLKNLLPYQEKVIQYKSIEHVQLFFAANYLISSHTMNYGIPLITTITEAKRTQMHNIFLQHGITGLKNINSFYGKKTHPGLIDTFIVSSQREKELVQSELGYPEEEIKITGLPRFDELLKGANLWSAYWTRKKILIMPSWRRGQDHLSDADFKQTNYYHAFQNLLTDLRLQELILDKKISVSFYLHNNFQKYRHLFHADGIDILDSAKVNVQHLMKTHGIMVTDYSSVGLDFALQNRSVIYYQFEENIPEIRDAEKQTDFLTGPIFSTAEEVIAEIKRKIKWNRLDKQYRKKLRENLYEQLDTKACERIYDELIKIEKN